MMASVMLVAPDPAGTLVGEKLAVAPEGNPLIERLTAEVNLSPLGGVTASV